MKLLKSLKKKLNIYDLYSLTIFVGSFLLFSIQPLVGKKILPWFGGFSSVWTTLMVFFLTTLFLGYLYTTWISHLQVKRQKRIHVTLILISIASIVINFARGGSLILQLGVSPSIDPIIGLLATSFFSLGLPYFLLSTTSTLLQSWYSKVGDEKSTYSLYQVSNVGSLLGLLTYPFLIEPNLTVSQQENVWILFFIGFAILMGKTTLNIKGNNKLVKEKFSLSSINFPSLLTWTAISMVSNTVLLATTSQLTQGLPPVVFLWVFPLGLYLLSYIIAFSNRDWYSPKFHITLMIVTTALNITFMTGIVNIHLTTIIFVSLLNSFLIFLICHRELFVSKPKTSGLPFFYLGIALGGVLASVFCSIVAPIIFTEFWEFPLALSAAVVLGLEALWKDEEGLIKKFQFGMISFFVIVFISYAFSQAHADTSASAFKSILIKRNFYGILKITSNTFDGNPLYTLINGVISHGTQYMSGDKMYEPTTYYTRESGVGVSIDKNPKRLKGETMRIGVVGLGAGTLAAYCQTGDYIKFYEINPDVITLSEEYFSYIKHCKEIGGTVDIVEGDARLSLQKEIDDGKPQKFDVLVLDAFSDDMIPVHLMTKEATELYFKHLNTNGVVAFHISNKFLTLNKPLATMVEQMNLYGYEYNMGSSWFMISPTPVNLTFQQFNPAAIVDKPERMWTDDYSNILSVLIKPNKR